MMIVDVVEKVIDEALALIVVVPIIGVLCWLALKGLVGPEVLVNLATMVLVYYFVKKSEKSGE